jgi:tetratricopeptide (TPR) repeat protein
LTGANPKPANALRELMAKSTSRSRPTRQIVAGVANDADRSVAEFAAAAGTAACLAAACIVPSLFDPRAERIFDEPKVLILRSVAVLAAACLLTWVIECRRSPWLITSAIGRQTAPLAAAALLTAAYVTAWLSSIAPRIAWDGAYVRREGTYTFLCDLIFFLVICFFVRTRGQASRLTLTFLLASVFPVAYAICQRLGVDLLLWNNPTPSRVTSTAGNSIFLGGYLIMVWPVALAQTVQTGLSALRRNHPAAPACRHCTLAAFSCLALVAAQTAAIVFTGSVGVWLALAGGILVLLGILLNWLVSLRTRICLLIIAVVSVGALGLLAAARRPISSASGSTATQSSVTASRSGEVRLLLWRSAVELLRQQPMRALIGYGPDTIRFTLGRYQPAAVRKLEGPATADRAHNGVLDAVLMVGLVGLFGQTLFFGTICLCAMRRLGLVTSVRDASFLGASIAVSLIVCFGLAYRLDHGGGLLPIAWSGGLVGGMLSYLMGRGLLRRTADSWNATALQQAAFMAGIVGHYAEVQTGIGSATSELYFWLFAAMIAAPVFAEGDIASDVAARGEKSVAAALSNTDSNGHTLVSGVVIGLLAVVIAFDFADRVIERWPMLLPFVVAGSALAFGAALRLRDDRVGVTFVSASLGIWLTFVSVSMLWVVFHSGGDAADSARARLTSGAGLLVALCLTIVTACAVIAGSRRGSGPLCNVTQRTRFPRRRTIAVALLLFTIIVPVTVFTNLNALRADELSGLGTALMNANQPQTAEWFYSQAFALQPRQDVYLARQGQSLTAASRSGTPGLRAQLLERAKNAYLTAHRINPYEPDHLLQLARVEGLWADGEGAADERRHHLENASGYLDAAARLRPRDPVVLNEWGKIRLREEDFPGARVLLERSLSLDDESSATHLLYADSLLGGGFYEQALREYERAEMLSSEESLPAISGRALALARMTRFAEAIEANTRALEVAPDDYTSRKNLALLYEQVGDLSRAASFAAAAAAVAHESEKEAIAGLVDELQRRSAKKTRSR